MAPSFRGRKNLVCFYCNQRSGLRYDGFMTKWDCPQCESTNFLDENGEITDPPVATEIAAPGSVQYGISQPGPLPFSQESEHPLFCSTCIKNQHLFTASLAQFDVELDARDPNFKQREKEYFAFRRRMEKNYPQVCGDCEPRVLGRMREAGMTAKADHLRRLMEKTRARRTQTRPTFSVTACIEMAGKILWYFGLIGQLSWSVGILVAYTSHASPQTVRLLPPSAIKSLDLFADISASDTWVRSSLFCSIATIWWNPMFRAMNKGFVEHITGFGEWYKLQALMIVSRFIFYLICGTELLAETYSQAKNGAHIAMFLYILFLAKKSQRSLKVDTAPLWQSTPERLVNIRPKSDGPRQDADSLADILDSIANAPATGHGDLEIPSLSPQNHNQNRFPSSHGPILHSTNRSQIVGTNSGLLLDSVRNQFPQSPSPGGQIPTSTRLLTQELSAPEDEMDWVPATPKESKHRAFKPVTSSERTSGVFDIRNESSPFWYKVPPAPITPAQRLRNPPNQPRFQPTSQKVKENYFRDITQRNDLQSNTQKAERRTMEMKPPKFFPPPPASEVGNSLSDLLNSFSLGSTDSESPVLAKNTNRWEHVGQAVALTLGLFFWNQAFSNPGDHSAKVLLAVMSGCMAIAARTVILHVLMTQEEGKVTRSIGLTLGGIECISALYGLTELIAGRVEDANYAFLGSILLGGMLIQELWYAASSAQ